MILVDKCGGYYLHRNLSRYLNDDVVYPLQDIKIKEKVVERVPIHDSKIKKFCKRHDVTLITSDWKMHFDAPNWGVKSILIPYMGNGWNTTTELKTIRVLQKLGSEYFRLWQIGMDVINSNVEEIL